ncbi:cytochrome c heme lyase subunit CcmH [Blastochloris viridis]|uniref:Cytochrome c heme lyase subunit CcmH n=1 Tax=Blastochloris viridis TaxID=1079 RepID=A0A182D3N5_BLAVI|nr:cytochrome c heme lyase subunit CcmH [Blastochloris viridis]
MFWVTLASMTALAALAVLLPLVRRRTAAAAPDLAIYRDQLAEVERDLAGGQITAAEAGAARVEVKRRLLAAADRLAASAPGAARARGWAVAAAGLVVVPMLAVGTYLVIGVPDLPDQPIAARRDAPSNHQDFAVLIEQVEARLAENPDDGRGWEVLAPVYMRSGRYADAVRANQNAMRLLGESADRLAGLGESMFAAAGDVVTPEARAIFERVAAMDARQPKARYFLGVADHQEGKRESAAARWRMQLADTAPDSPWREVLEQSLAEIAAEAAKSEAGKSEAGKSSEASNLDAGKPEAANVLPGPRVENMQPAAEPSAEAQTAMVRAMVEMLAQKLQNDRGDVEGWMRLMRGHMTLGEADKARAALADARTALQAEPDKLRNVETFAKGLGLGG